MGKIKNTKFLTMNKVFVVAILLLSMTAYTQQGAKAVITALADECMNGNNVKATVQSRVHTAINTAFAAMGRRRMLEKRRLGTMVDACKAVFDSAYNVSLSTPAFTRCLM